MDHFNFCKSGHNRYVGFTDTLRAEITQDATGKRHLEIVNRNTPRNRAAPSTIVLFESSAASVQACKKRANNFFKEAC